MTDCFGCGKVIEGKIFYDKDGNPKTQEKPIYDNQNQPNCIHCMMVFIGMEYRREYLRLKAEQNE